MQLRDWLTRSRAHLVADLHPDDIIDQLIGPGLLSYAEESEINGLATREAKTRCLIRLIDQREGDDLLTAFHAALKADYPWLTAVVPDLVKLSPVKRIPTIDLAANASSNGVPIPLLVAIPTPAASSQPMRDVRGVVGIDPIRRQKPTADAEVVVDGGAILIPPLAAIQPLALDSRPISGVPAGVENNIACPEQATCIPPLVACSQQDSGMSRASNHPIAANRLGNQWLTQGVPVLSAVYSRQLGGYQFLQPIGGVLGVESAGQAEVIRPMGDAPGAGNPYPPPPLCPQPVTHAHIDPVASNAIVLANWRGIARDLGVIEADIASVTARVPLDPRGQCYEILRIWALDYDGACLQALVGVLRKNGLNRLGARLMQVNCL